jgi:hypothetical protein
LFLALWFQDQAKSAAVFQAASSLAQTWLYAFLGLLR